MFYNTTNLTGDQLKTSRTAVENQDIRVLRIFTSNPGVAMTPVDVQQRLQGKPMLLTSVRRALHTLTEQGYLNKTSQRVVEQYGALNHQWILSNKTITN